MREIFISGYLPFHCHKVRYFIMDIPLFYNFPGYHTNTHTHAWYLMGEEAWGKFVKNKQLIDSRRCATTTHKLFLFLYYDNLNKKLSKMYQNLEEHNRLVNKYLKIFFVVALYWWGWDVPNTFLWQIHFSNTLHFLCTGALPYWLCSWTSTC